MPRHCKCREACRGIRLLVVRSLRRKWTKDKTVGNEAVKFNSDPVSLISCPPFWICRSTINFGMGCIVLRSDLHRAANLPGRVLGTGRSRAGDGDFESLKLVRNLRSAASQFVIKANRKIGPGLGVVSVLYHVCLDVEHAASGLINLDAYRGEACNGPRRPRKTVLPTILDSCLNKVLRPWPAAAPGTCRSAVIGIHPTSIYTCKVWPHPKC